MSMRSVSILLICASTSFAASPKELARDLGHESFKKREAATKALVKLGRASIDVAIDAMFSDDPEIEQRGGDILHALMQSDDAETKAAAKAVLKMAASSTTAKEVHELFALRKVAQKVLDRIKAHGGSYQRNSKDEVYSVRLQGQQTTTEDMLCLKSMLSMTELRIENTSKIDADAITETLGLLKQLRTLYLVDVKQLKDDSLATFKSMPTLRTLRLHSVPVTDKGLAHLKDHPYLRYVHILSCDKITDDGLSALSGLKRLYDLRLVECTKITNEGLKHLRNAPSLRNLDLRKTSIDDGVIQYLWDINNLRSVYIDKDQISADAIEVLKNKLPRCRVTTPAASTTSKRSTGLKIR